MQTSIENELKHHVLDKFEDGVLDNDNRDEWHHLAFNSDYYIIGRHQAKEWLKEHDIDAFEAIAEVVEYEKDHFGEITTDISEPERVVNMLTYIYGEEIIYGLDDDLKAKKIKKALREELLS